MAKRSRRAESRCRYYVRDLAGKKGWDLRHVAKGGDVLEEQEIVDQFSDIGLGLDRPDFVFCLHGSPVIVVETKNEAGKLDKAIEEATAYADQINRAGRHPVYVAVGAAGAEDTGFQLGVRFLRQGQWVPLTSRGFEITSFPSPDEARLALASGNGSTQVAIPSQTEFIDAAVEISRVLRLAKIEAPLRPKVIGAVVLALYEGDVDVSAARALESVNRLTAQAIDTTLDLEPDRRERLKDALRLSGADFNRLDPFLGRVVDLLRRLNIRSVIRTDADFLGMFYEAFLRYGYDNNALGIVFTPRHVTRMCVDLVTVDADDSVIDVACGTGGFLVSAYDAMMARAESDEQRTAIKASIAGFDTNPTVWALAMLNMFFRGDGKSRIRNESSLDPAAFAPAERAYTRSFLNPPFSQDEEPESRFIDQALAALRPGKLLAAVVKAGVFADDEHRGWRRDFLRKHQLQAVISLPEDVFYPTAAPTSILIAKAHVPHRPDAPVFLGRVFNDGYAKLKGRRVPAPGEQLSEVVEAYRAHVAGAPSESRLATRVLPSQLSDGAEWSPQEWLPQPALDAARVSDYADEAIRRVFQAIASLPDLADAVLSGFADEWAGLPALPYGQRAAVADFFHLHNGRSSGEKNYADGDYPYVSSGDLDNSILRLAGADASEIFAHGGITVTAFGLACVQPWRFMARGNGGSSVRVLIPKYRMSVPELAWFAGEINAQRWRFFYARMAIKSRLARLTIEAPAGAIPDATPRLDQRIRRFQSELASLSTLR